MCGLNGKALPDGKTYKGLMLERLNLDLARVHFTGLLPYGQYLQVLQASSAHVYLTRPFVLSWSMLEAMSVGCVIVGSTTPPVQEVIRDGDILFPYQLLPGKASTRNAIRLLQMMGYEEQIIKKASGQAENFLKTGKWINTPAAISEGTT